MCGINGLVTRHDINVVNIVSDMNDTIFHRGPDDSAVFSCSAKNYNVGLGHQRLSIQDLSASGSQPMEFNDLVVVYNGEVYNFSAIRDELVEYGYSFSSGSDTEVILKAYDLWGISCRKYPKDRRL